jgi:hypothetical protein
VAKANGMLALLIGGGKKPPIGLLSKKKKKEPEGSSRDDLKVAARDFANAQDDDARVDALLAFQDLSRDYERED